jgi:CheY-like chemotaxis protein
MRGSRRIFVADDSPVARLSVTRPLRADGREVLEATSAADALAHAPGAKALACALLDLDLGDGDGAAVAIALRREDPALPIAFFSASVSGDVVERARAIGPIFAKPAALADALAWIAQHADRG